jgi:hypothetical protein
VDRDTSILLCQRVVHMVLALSSCIASSAGAFGGVEPAQERVSPVPLPPNQPPMRCRRAHRRDQRRRRDSAAPRPRARSRGGGGGGDGGGGGWCVTKEAGRQMAALQGGQCSAERVSRCC